MPEPEKKKLFKANLKGARFSVEEAQEIARQLRKALKQKFADGGGEVKGGLTPSGDIKFKLKKPPKKAKAKHDS